jgi:BolA protein
MNVKTTIEERLRDVLEADPLIVVDESHTHNVPAGSQTHFNAIVVSGAFEGKNRIARQRTVYAALTDLMGKPIHALTMKTLTPAEWKAADGRVGNPPPKCMGGSKHDAKA